MATTGANITTEIGVLLHINREFLEQAFAGIRSVLQEAPTAPYRIAGISTNRDNIEVTIAVSLGPVADVANAGPLSLAGLDLVSRLVLGLANLDAALATVPATDSPEALKARELESTVNLTRTTQMAS